VASGGRHPDSLTGKLPPIGDTVDIGAARYVNTVGAAILSTVWTDPEFDATQPALYYVRVLEILTPRWSTYDAKTLGVAPMMPETLQERAITSAIWYAPDANAAPIASPP
jgi:hypothetical protein